MNYKSYCSPAGRPPPAHRSLFTRLAAIFVLAVLAGLSLAPRGAAGDAPGWMHALTSAPLPAHDEKTDAVLLYSEHVVTVQSADKIKSLTRIAYKILRTDGRHLGTVAVPYSSDTKINYIHAWCIPAQGKDYEIKDKDGLDIGLPGVAGSELISDVRAKLLRIPAPDPGNIIGYEYEQESRPYILQEIWDFQGSHPVGQARFTLQMPAGWEYKAVWLNHPDVAPTGAASQWQWQVNDVPAIKEVDSMPPMRGIAGQLMVFFFPPGGVQNKSYSTWRDLGGWYAGLTRGRREPTPDIKSKVADLTKLSTSSLEKMRVLARFAQRDIRYVAIELGIGGYQPHAAADVFTHHYGDCKDKATLLSTMLREIGIDSYYVLINTQRGIVGPAIPPSIDFNHAILGIHLPDGLADDSLIAWRQVDKLGRILFFDPTDDYTPLGQLSSSLQSNYGLLLTEDGGQLMELPPQPPGMNGIERTGRFSLSSTGTLTGAVREVRLGDRAASQRAGLRTAAADADKVKPLETLLAHSLATFRLTKASVQNIDAIEQPFIFNYELVADNYAKPAGNLLLLRPRVLGLKSSDILESKEPRKVPVVFDGPSRDTDDFEISLPAGFTVDAEDLPPPVNAEYGFASYRSKAEVHGNVLRYTRTLEVKELLVPVNKLDELKKFYRIISGDERNTAVLSRAGAP